MEGWPSELHFPVATKEGFCCAKCGGAVDRNHVTRFLKRRCRWVFGAGPQRIWQWSGMCHELSAEGAPHCGRCGGTVPELRRARFAQARCPAWRILSGGESTDWGPSLLRLLRIPVAGLGSPPQGADVVPGAVSGPPQGVNVLVQPLRWLPHRPLVGGGRVTCFVCGWQARSWQLLAATPCGGWISQLPGTAQALLLAPGALVAPAGLTPAAAATARLVLQQRLRAVASELL